MKNKTFLLAALMGFSLTASAQKITTEQAVIDLGQVLFRTPATAEFELKNKSGDRLTITNVRSSCGCTQVGYPQTVVPSGQSFKVTATYDAATMGHFEKRLAVYTTAESEPTLLTLRGVVVDEVVDYSGDYPFELGRLRADKDNIEFDDVNNGERPVQKIHIINSSDKTAQPVLMHLPPYLSAQVSPSTIAPGKAGVVLLTLNSDQLHDYGLSQTTIYLGHQAGDKVSQEKSITVSAVLLPGFSDEEQDALHQPQLRLASSNLTLSSGSGKKKKKGEMLLENAGTAPLEIQSLQMFTPGIQVTLSSRTIQPGQTVRLRATANVSDLKEARTQPRILMITNDPNHQKVVINILTADAN